jgi:hypothetical protein
MDVLLSSGAPATKCDGFRDFAITSVNASKPELVLLTTAPSTLLRLSSGATGQAALTEWRNGTQETFDGLRGLEVVSLDGPPDMPPLVDCAITGSAPADCISTPARAFIDAAVVIRDVAVAYPNVTVPSNIGWFCDESGQCPAFIDGTPTLADVRHLTETASTRLGPLMREALGVR